MTKPTNSIKSIPYQSKNIANELKPKTVEMICNNYNKPEAQIHCTGMACNGMRAYFCYTPKKKIGDYKK